MLLLKVVWVLSSSCKGKQCNEVTLNLCRHSWNQCNYSAPWMGLTQTQILICVHTNVDTVICSHVYTNTHAHKKTHFHVGTVKFYVYIYMFQQRLCRIPVDMHGNTWNILTATVRLYRQISGQTTLRALVSICNSTVCRVARHCQIFGTEYLERSSPATHLH